VPEKERVQYIPWDFKYYAKLRGGQVLSDIAPVAARCLDATGLFLCAPAPPSSEARRTNASDWVRLSSWLLPEEAALQAPPCIPIL
jgi:hypothetical protein